MISAVKILLGLGLLTAGSLRLTIPAIGSGELKDMPFLTQRGEYAIAVGELVGGLVLLAGPSNLQKLVLFGYIITTLLITVYYIKDIPLKDFIELIPYRKNAATVFYHVLLVILMLIVLVAK